MLTNQRKQSILEKLAGAKRYLRLEEQLAKSGLGADSPLGRATDRARTKYERRISGPAVDRAEKFMKNVPPDRGSRAFLKEIRRRPREFAGTYKDTIKALPRTMAYHQRVGFPGGLLPMTVEETARAAVKAGPATGKKALKWRIAKKLLFKGKG